MEVELHAQKCYRKEMKMESRLEQDNVVREKN